MRKALVVCGALAGLAFGASAVPVFSADGGAVNAQVTATAGPAACITLPAATVDFGTLPFNAAGASTVSLAAPIKVTGCANGGMVLLARGTDATSANAAWTLTGTTMCPSTPVSNQYNLGLSANGGASTDNLTTTDAVVWAQMGPSEEVSKTPTIAMPCVGSIGAGQTMTMSYVFTATLP